VTELAILIPVRRRPYRIQLVLDSIRAATPEARVLFVCDEDDPDSTRAILDRSGHPQAVRGIVRTGNYAHKINSAIKETDEPLLLFGADDLHFHPGWFEVAKRKMTDGIGVVATNDLCNGMVMEGRLATHPLVSREYAELGSIDDPSVVLHEGYPHEYVDREFSETAMAREAFAYAPDSIVEHLHPMVGKASWSDPLYSAMRGRMRQGARIYARRRPLWT
jgi:glycosyltransferase involved in cell wall biosynthesis